jgi:hypothetical protein
MSLRLKGTILTAVLALAVSIALNPIAAAASAPPVYPGAVATTRPAGVGMKAPPASAKTYVTADSFTKVKAWYQAHLKGAQEMQQPGMEKTEDAFLVGTAASGMVVLVQSHQGKTYIVIGPPV